MIEFYDCELSTDAYKARLLMTLLGLEWTTRLVEYYPRREHRSDWFLRINPRGELPVLVDNGAIVEDAQAVLVFIARNHDPSGRWYPGDNAALIAQISTWLSFADALTQTASAARLHDGLLYHHIDVASCRAGAHELLGVLDEHLWFAEYAGHAWLCPAGHPTIADIACFPDVALAEEGGICMREYRAVQRWTTRVRRLPGFVPMAGIFTA
jgi:glutathione S-transferase